MFAFWHTDITLLHTHCFQYALAVMMASPLCAAPMYSVVNLGGLGGARSEVFTITGSGIAAGVATTAGREIALPVVHDGTGTRALSSSRGQVNGVSDSGAAVGTTFTRTGARATVWNEKGEHVLSTLGGAESYGLAINGTGNIIGSSMTASGYAHAFLTLADEMVDLGTLGGGWSSAYGVNDALDVVGYSMTSSGNLGAFFWSPATGMFSLPALGGANSYAFGINESGSVVGAANASDGYLKAFLYQNGSTRSLGTLGGTTSSAYGINSSGDVVGYSSDSRGRLRAFIWRDGVMYDLNSLAGGRDGWTLDAAYAINDSGQIVGRGTYQGQTMAFRLDPVFTPQMQSLSRSSLAADVAPVPEPASAILMLFGSAILWFWKTDGRYNRRR
jgi:probable HAF family extracellular repeat protein